MGPCRGLLRIQTCWRIWCSCFLKMNGHSLNPQTLHCQQLSRISCFPWICLKIRLLFSLSFNSFLKSLNCLLPFHQTFQCTWTRDLPETFAFYLSWLPIFFSLRPLSSHHPTQEWISRTRSETDPCLKLVLKSQFEL